MVVKKSEITGDLNEKREKRLALVERDIDETLRCEGRAKVDLLHYYKDYTEREKCVKLLEAKYTAASWTVKRDTCSDQRDGTSWDNLLIS